MKSLILVSLTLFLAPTLSHAECPKGSEGGYSFASEMADSQGETIQTEGQQFFETDKGQSEYLPSGTKIRVGSFLGQGDGHVAYEWYSITVIVETPDGETRETSGVLNVDPSNECTAG